MTALDLKTLCDEAIKIARGAGDIVMEYYHNGAKEMIKSDGTDVTEADLASDRYITEKLKALTPDIPVVTEEGIEVGVAPDVSGGRYWVCDPIDGTIPFMRRHDNFSILIALIDDFRPVIGIAYYPAKNEYFYAIKGQGSFHVNASANEEKRITTQPHKATFPFVVCSPIYNKEENFFERIPNIPKEFALYQEGLHFYELLTGKIDVIVFTMIGGGEWDAAAFQVILEEAGGKFEKTMHYGDITQKLSIGSAHAHPSSLKFLDANS